jgi:hypothetical protein
VRSSLIGYILTRCGVLTIKKDEKNLLLVLRRSFCLGDCSGVLLFWPLNRASAPEPVGGTGHPLESRIILSHVAGRPE